MTTSQDMDEIDLFGKKLPKKRSSNRPASESVHEMDDQSVNFGPLST